MNTENLKKAQKVIRALNHKMRQEIIKLIDEKGQMCVTDIYVKLRIEQSVASQMLAIMRKERVLVTERQGKSIIYKVNHERIKQINDICDELIK